MAGQCVEDRQAHLARSKLACEPLRQIVSDQRAWRLSIFVTPSGNCALELATPISILKSEICILSPGMFPIVWLTTTNRAGSLQHWLGANKYGKQHTVLHGWRECRRIGN